MSETKQIFCSYCGHKQEVRKYSGKWTCPKCNTINVVGSPEKPQNQTIVIDNETYTEAKKLSDLTGMRLDIFLRPIIRITAQVVEILLLLRRVK